MFVSPFQPFWSPFSVEERTVKLDAFLALCPNFAPRLKEIDQLFSKNNPNHNDQAFTLFIRLLNDHIKGLKPEAFLAGIKYLMQACQHFEVTGEHRAVILFGAIVYHIKNPDLTSQENELKNFCFHLADILKLHKRPLDWTCAQIKAISCYNNSISHEFSDLNSAINFGKHLLFFCERNNKDLDDTSSAKVFDNIEKEIIFPLASVLKAHPTALGIIMNYISRQPHATYHSGEVEITLSLLNHCASPLHTRLNCAQNMSSYTPKSLNSNIKGTPGKNACLLHMQFFMGSLECLAKTPPSTLHDLTLMLESIHETFLDLELNSKTLNKIFECFYNLMRKYQISNCLNNQEIEQVYALYAKTFSVKPIWLNEAEGFCYSVYKKCRAAKLHCYDRFLFSLKIMPKLINAERNDCSNEARSQRYSSWLSINLAGCISGAFQSPVAIVEPFEPRLVLELVQEAFLSLEWSPAEVKILKKLIISHRIPIKFVIIIIRLVMAHKTLFSSEFMALFLDRVLTEHPHLQNLKMNEYVDILIIFNASMKIDKKEFGQQHLLSLAKMASVRWEFNQFFFKFDKRDRREVLSDKETAIYYFGELKSALELFLESYDLEKEFTPYHFVINWMASVATKLIQIETFKFLGRNYHGLIVPRLLPVQEVKRDLIKVLSHFCELLMLFRVKVKNELQLGFNDSIYKLSKDIYFEPIYMLDKLVQLKVEGLSKVDGVGFFVMHGESVKLIFNYDIPEVGKPVPSIVFGEL